MRFVSFKQFLLLIIVFFFLFGDFFSLKKKLNRLFIYLNNFIDKNDRKKGI